MILTIALGIVLAVVLIIVAVLAIAAVIDTMRAISEGYERLRAWASERVLELTISIGAVMIVGVIASIIDASKTL
jgi:uncharacterized membrane protein YdcZ (DUF606 family)